MLCGSAVQANGEKRRVEIKESREKAEGNSCYTFERYSNETDVTCKIIGSACTKERGIAK